MRQSRVALAGLLMVGVVAACGGGGNNGGNGPPQLPPVTPTMAVSVINNGFNPPNAGVATSNTVTWTWNSAGVTHNVKWAGGPSATLPPDSPAQNTGMHQATFTTPGVYHYVCTLHSNMEGYVTVQ